MLCFPTLPINASALPCEIGNPEDSALVHCAGKTLQLLHLSRFVCPERCPQQPSPKLNTLITRFRESYSSVSMSRESIRLTKSSSWLNSDNALIQHLGEKCYFRVSPFCQVVQKHKLFEVAK